MVLDKRLSGKNSQKVTYSKIHFIKQGLYVNIYVCMYCLYTCLKDQTKYLNERRHENYRHRCKLWSKFQFPCWVGDMPVFIGFCCLKHMKVMHGQVMGMCQKQRIIKTVVITILVIHFCHLRFKGKHNVFSFSIFLRTTLKLYYGAALGSV